MKLVVCLFVCLSLIAGDENNESNPRLCVAIYNLEHLSVHSSM